MENPPKKPKASDGKQSVWVRPVKGFVYRGRAKKGKARVRVQVILRKGHWRTVSISVKADKARARGGLWVPVSAYERELELTYELAGADPIYRYHHDTDLARTLGGIHDPLHNLIWGSAFNGQDVQGRFVAMRIWYVVRDTNLDRFYLYGRTASFGVSGSNTPLRVGSLSSVKRYVSRLEGEISEEYEEKDYMELVRFVGWTAFGETKIMKHHRRRARLSKEKGFDFDPYKMKFKRVITPWETRVVQKAITGRGDLPSVLTRDYRGSAKAFREALGKLSKKARRIAKRYFMLEVQRMEKALERKRTGK